MIKILNWRSDKSRNVKMILSRAMNLDALYLVLHRRWLSNQTVTVTWYDLNSSFDMFLYKAKFVAMNMMVFINYGLFLAGVIK